MTLLTLSILFFGLVFGLVGFGLLLGYLLFGRRKEVVYRPTTAGGSGRTVVVDRGGSNLLGTAAAVAGGVVAGELIADAVEDLVDGEEIVEGVEEVGEDIVEGVEDFGEAVSDAFDDFGDVDF